MTTPSRRPNIRDFLNSIPTSETRELGEETGWAAWNDALETSDRQFAPTAMNSIPMPVDGHDRPYAKTAPQGLSSTKTGDIPPVPRPPKTLTSDEVMVEARKNNRVCPKPRRWAELFGLLSQWAHGELPAPPLTGDMWHRTPALAKRMSFRDHIEWAEHDGCLPQLFEFLKALPEEEWHHIGD